MKSKHIWSITALAGLSAAAGLIFGAAVTPDGTVTGYLGQLEVTNYNLTSGHEVVFKTDYEKQNWTGNVFAYPISSAAVINTAAEWWSGGAQEHLEAQDFDSGRLIVTMKDDGTKQPFRWANLSTTQQGQIGTSTTGPTILNFVRGDRSNERTTTIPRVRAAVLGDIVHSRPYYLPNNGAPVLFVGANDGMLHAFDADTAAGGDELWAYVPSMLIPNLKALAGSSSTSPIYTHTYFVDGGLNVGDAVISGSNKKILVGGLGAGGSGLFALDVTNPTPSTEAQAAANILWEITPSRINGSASTAYASLGYTYSTPVIGKVNSGSGQSAVIIGNGYTSSSTGPKSTLFVINAADGSLIKAIVTSGAAAGGLSSPTCFDATGDGRIDYCYAGDIDGKLWKFDLSSTNSGSWTATLLYTTSPAQPITMAPAVAMHPYGGYMVDFATGQILTAADATDTSTYYAYGIWDGAPSTNSALLTQTLTAKTYTNPTTSATTLVRTVTANQAKWTAQPVSCVSPCVPSNYGWRVPLPVAGERAAGDGAFIENGRFYFTTTNPTATASHTPPQPDGDLWLMELDYLSGSTANSPFFDLSGDMKLTNDDRVGGDTSTAGIPVGKFVDNGIGSHPILVQLDTLNTTLLNENPDVDWSPTLVDGGVSNGHFDLDIYYPTFDGTSQLHVHQYDDIYNVTGVDMLNASNTGFNLVNGIPSTSTKFKVLIENQYLSPAVTVRVGTAPFVSVKTYNNLATETVAANVIANAPTYTRGTAGFNLEFNLPLDAFSAKDWWGNGDVRAGLQPTQTGCVHTATKPDTVMFQPVIPPADGVEGPGTNSTTSGVRYNGAFVIQLIKDTTPASALEMSVPGRPEYGWRVKADKYTTFVLTEYTTFWHHPNKFCYGQAGWTKAPPPDTSGGAKAITPAAGSDDPKYGSFQSTSGITSVTSTTSGNVTTTVTVYANGTQKTVTETSNPDGTLTRVTINPDGTSSTVTLANPKGKLDTGGDERGSQARTGRISWTELLRK